MSAESNLDSRVESELSLLALPAQIEPTVVTGMRKSLAVLLPAFVFILGLCAVAWGVVLLATAQTNDLYSIPLLVGICVALQLMTVDIQQRYRRWDIQVILLSILAFVLMLVLRQLPPHITGYEINAIFDKTLFASIFLLILSVPVMGVALHYLFGYQPHAEDIARYPLILLPIVLVIGLYCVLIAQVIIKGIPNLQETYLNQPFIDTILYRKEIVNNWPSITQDRVTQIGLLSQIKGTGLLMLMTTLISLPIGVGAGLYLSEFGHGPWAGVARFIVNSLRAMSLLVLGFSARDLVRLSSNTPLESILHGVHINNFGEEVVNSYGSFLAASLALSLLVIPMIARATELGSRSLPVELREGSLALGASLEVMLRRMILPWALPDIVTAVLLGCAEVAGSVAVIMFIAGPGMDGVGVLREVTSLAYMIFDVTNETGLMKPLAPLQFTSGMLLLIITLTIGALGLLVKRLLVTRYRGG